MAKIFPRRGLLGMVPANYLSNNTFMRRMESAKENSNLGNPAGLLGCFPVCRGKP
jgi:hypothetical protein